MRHYVLTLALLCFSPALLRGNDETPEQAKAVAQKLELCAPFDRMNETIQTASGIQKLSLAEQEALASWWRDYQQQEPKLRDVTKELTITAIQDSGKHMVLSDGGRISFSSSARKKVSTWTVGDTIGVGTPGKKGSVTLYHLATGQKAKAKREQAPKVDGPK